MQRTITTMTPRQRSEELGAWRSGSRTDRLYASAALAARSPEAVRGRLAVETGVIISASEEGGVTALSVGVGTYGLRPLTVVYPGTADERIVAEARVRVYGLWSVRDNAATLVAAWLEPL